MEEGRWDGVSKGAEGEGEGGGMEEEEAALLSDNVEEFLRDVTAALGRQRVGVCVNVCLFLSVSLSRSLSLLLSLSLSLTLSLGVRVALLS